MNWYIEVLKKYVTFSGRARRTEYWMFTLFNLIAAVILMAIDGALGSAPILYSIYMLAVLLPSLAVTIRRLHDTDRSGWWLLLVLIPLVGPIAMLVFMCLEGTRDENRFGADPKAALA